MKIAQVAPLYEAVPPRLYGGTERVVAHLTNALIAQGHDVTLFAAGDMRTRATPVFTRRRALRLDDAPLKSDLASHLSMLHEVRRRADAFDVVHFHIDMLHFPLFEEIAAKTLTTLHGRLDIADLPDAYGRWSDFPLVSISNHQRLPMPQAHWLATVHHGVDPVGLPYKPAPEGDYLAFLGRISPEKRPDRAIAIAKASGVPLRLAAKVDAVDRDYFERAIRPLLDDPLVHFIGEIGDAQKGDFLGNARALLFPIDWPEPFGLVMIEAMACGTPVIAWRCGAVSEVIDAGVTGCVVDDLDQAVAAVETVRRLPREAVCAVFERRFTAQGMAARYAQLYRKIASHSPASTRLGLAA